MLKSSTPTPRSDMPTPGTSATPGLRPGLGKPPAMDPLVNQAGRVSPLMLCLAFPFSDWFVIGSRRDAIVPWTWNALNCLPPSCLSEKSWWETDVCPWVSAAAPCSISNCLHLAFLLFPINPNPRDFNNVSDHYSKSKLLPRLLLCEWAH